jgi:hypothetical protein
MCQPRSQQATRRMDTEPLEDRFTRRRVRRHYSELRLRPFFFHAEGSNTEFALNLAGASKQSARMSIFI